MAEKVRILAPVDGTPEGEAVVPVAAKLMELYDGELMLVRLVEAIDAFGPYERSDIVRMVEENRAYLHDLVQRWELPVEQTQCLVNHTDNTAKEIIHIASSTEASVIVMVGHRRKGLLRWLRGSVCDEVVRARVCPVVVVPAEGGDWYKFLAEVVPTGADEIAKTPE
jgi:nucleotide-binding universal stress UspA family protein